MTAAMASVSVVKVMALAESATVVNVIEATAESTVYVTVIMTAPRRTGSAAAHWVLVPVLCAHTPSVCVMVPASTPIPQHVDSFCAVLALKAAALPLTVTLMVCVAVLVVVEAVSTVDEATVVAAAVGGGVGAAGGGVGGGVPEPEPEPEPAPLRRCARILNRLPWLASLDL